MSEDPALYLAGRVGEELSPSPTEAELLHLCAQRGVAVRYCARLRGAGYYLAWPEPLIVLRPGCPAEVTAHELWHHLAADAVECGIDYGPPHWQPDHPEALARRFAATVCSQRTI